MRASSVSLQKLLIIVEGTFRLPHLASGVVGINHPTGSVLRHARVVR